MSADQLNAVTALPSGDSAILDGHMRTALARLARDLHLDLLTPYEELLAFPQPLVDLETAVRDEPFFRRKTWPSIHFLGLYRVALYALVRATRPGCVLETGVLHGITSNFILTGLHANATGRLLSVDAPAYAGAQVPNRDGYVDTLPPGQEPGWTVSAANRARWEMRLGRSADVLPLLGDVRCDIFVHDSEHTVATMWFECEWAWEHLAPGGLLVCDNMLDNSAFDDFCARVNRTPWRLPEVIVPTADPGPPRFGVIQR